MNRLVFPARYVDAIQHVQREAKPVANLLDRNARGVTLTPAGEVLLHEARAALDAVAAAARRTRRAGQRDPLLVLAMKPGGDAGLLPDILADYRTEPDSVEVEPLVCGIGEQAAVLRDGRADAAFLQLPYDDPARLDYEELLQQLLRFGIQRAALRPVS